MGWWEGCQGNVCGEGGGANISLLGPEFPPRLLQEP